ncbi:hypothetical protein PoB_007626100 [Plakobranchus ocellatus]|uniref:Uncharacterized protein n=1 Tax=Plakobranchus ocellatus TaxID=259542 RepID=A0AAV4E0X2_9GAST|nr:hypothetical protein PoB_007626100 [Plakobranchus ocellatus]
MAWRSSPPQGVGYLPVPKSLRSHFNRCQVVMNRRKVKSTNCNSNPNPNHNPNPHPKLQPNPNPNPDPNPDPHPNPNPNPSLILTNFVDRKENERGNPKMCLPEAISTRNGQTEAINIVLAGFRRSGIENLNMYGKTEETMNWGQQK